VEIDHKYTHMFHIKFLFNRLKKVRTWLCFEILSLHVTSVDDNYVFEPFCLTKHPAQVMTLRYTVALGTQIEKERVMVTIFISTAYPNYQFSWRM
jgi:uncharacterized PurR-regulated membrane protein YhhQ (DUF165 family)